MLDVHDGRQAACDAHVAAAKQHDTKEQQTASGIDLKQSVETSERESPVRSAEKNQKAALFKDNASDEVGTRAELSENRCEDVVQEAKIQPLLSETEREKGEVEQKKGSTKPTTEYDAAEAKPGAHAVTTQENNATALGTRFEIAAVISSLKDLTPGVENVEEKVKENKRENYGVGELCTDFTKLDLLLDLRVKHGEEAVDATKGKVKQEISSTGGLEETHDGCVNSADDEPTAAETEPGPPDRSSSENNTAISEPRSDVSDSLSVPEQVTSSQHLLPPAADDPVKDLHLKHNDAVHAQSQDKSEEQRTETDDQECVSQSEKPKDELEQPSGCSETESDSNVAGAVILGPEKYSDKPPTAVTEPEELSKVEEESESHGDSLEYKTQTESTHNDVAVVMKVYISKDGEKPVS